MSRRCLGAGSSSRRRFLLDVESTSTLDLRTAGAEAYWAHPDTRIICLSYRVDDGPVIRWRPGDAVPYFVPELSLAGWRVVAHNWLFEYACWAHQLGPRYGWRLPPMEAWDCTMARALYWGLPASLEDAGGALDLSIQKDATARSLMLRLSKPRHIAPDGTLTWWHETQPDRLDELARYCDQDVLAECELDDALPPLPDIEWEIWKLDGEINRRGVLIDPHMIEALAALTRGETARLNAELVGLTGGRVVSVNQVRAILAELAQEGLILPNLAKGTIAAALAAGGPPMTPRARRLLACRAEAARASTGKLVAMQRGMSRDFRCRGLLQYGGAGRTLRWAGRRVQPQNFPRGSVPGLASVYRLLEAGITADELAPLLPGSVMDTVASALRGCIIAPPGHVLVSGDLSQIEARVLAWLAGQDDVLQVFAAGEDVYTYMAARVGSSDRQFGKVLVLACGFGMGPPKFQETAATFGMILTLAQAEDAVVAWRQANAATVSFWWDVDRVFKEVAAAPHGTSRTLGRLTIHKTRRAVRVTLPSGHEITYQMVEIGTDEFGRPQISYMGVDPRTKEWCWIRTYGARIVENIVQAVARDVMAGAMLRAAARGVRLILTVHDELLAEARRRDAAAALAALLADMTRPLWWADGLPVAAAGWTGPRYRK